jgi:cell wall-associated NlpC family hydrolase
MKNSFIISFRRNNFLLLSLFAVLFSVSCKVSKNATNNGATKNIKTESSASRAKKSNIIISEAKIYDGAPYKLGGESKNGIDCSGLVMLSFKKAGIALPRTSLEQSKIGTMVNLKDAMVGDLIFFKFKKINKKAINHVGIISKKESWGGIYFVHASSSLGVTESSLSESYYQEAFVKVMRVFE